MLDNRYPTPIAPQQYPANYPVNYPPQMPYGQQPAPMPLMPQAENLVNHLLRTAEPLLTLITQIRHTVEHPNVEALRAQIIEEMKLFERQLTSINYPMRTLIAARYCLCTAIDEAVLGQTWGTQSVWVQGSLLSIFQKETWGGERFYLILEDALRNIRQNIDLIELLYFLISLGFEGKFFGDEYRAAREEIRNRIFYHVRHARLKPERSLSPHWKNTAIPLTVQQKKSTLKRTALVSVSIIIIFALIYNISVYRHAKPTLNKLDALATVSPITVFSELIQRPIVLRSDDEDNN